MTVPTTAKAAALVQTGAPLELLDVRVPEELEHGAILVRTAAATICGTDIHAWQDPDIAPLPRILGHEMVGRIARLGAGVTADSVGEPLAEGDRIIWAHGFCGQCYECVVQHDPATCTGGVRAYMRSAVHEYPYLTGGFAEYCYVFPQSGRVKVPDEVPDVLAAAAACALRSVVAAFDRLGPLDERHSVVIQGAGPLGLFSVAKALTGGAGKVIVIGAPTARLEIARRWGAHETIDITEVPDAAQRAELVRGLTDGKGPDVVIEVSGARTAVPEGLDLVRRGGRYLVVGQLSPHTAEIRPMDFVVKHLRVIGSLSATIDHYYRALQFLVHYADRFSWEDLISNRYPLERINEAMEGMRTFTEIKPAITFETTRSATA